MAMIKSTKFLLTTFLLTLSTSTACFAQDKAATEKIVHDYLLKNPTVVYQALLNFQQQQATKKQAEVKKFIRNNQENIFHNKEDGVIGNPTGAVTLTVLSDYQCGFCRRSATAIDKMIIKYPGLRVVIKQLPILGKESINAAKIAVAATKQNEFSTVNQALLNVALPLTMDKVWAQLSKAKVAVKDYKKSVTKEQPSFDQHLQSNYKLAEQLEIRGTPVFLISGKDGKKIDFIANALGEDELDQLLKSYF